MNRNILEKVFKRRIDGRTTIQKQTKDEQTQPTPTVRCKELEDTVSGPGQFKASFGESQTLQRRRGGSINNIKDFITRKDCVFQDD